MKILLHSQSSDQILANSRWKHIKSNFNNVWTHKFSGSWQIFFKFECTLKTYYHFAFAVNFNETLNFIFSTENEWCIRSYTSTLQLTKRDNFKLCHFFLFNQTFGVELLLNWMNFFFAPIVYEGMWVSGFIMFIPLLMTGIIIYKWGHESSFPLMLFRIRWAQK